MKKITAYLLETRAGILSTTILPVLLGAAMAYHDTKRSGFFILLLLVLGFCLLHLGTNVINDYFDDEGGTDRVNEGFIGPFSGGGRMLQSGALSRGEVLAEAVLLFLLSAAFLVYVCFHAGIFVFLMFVFAVFSGIFYSAPPLKISYTGLGELLVALNLGPAVTLASYYTQTGTVNWNVLLVSIPAGLLTAVFVVIAGFPDHEADKKTGKKNLVVRAGPGKARYIFGFTSLAAYLVIAAGLIAGQIPVFGAWSLLGAVVSLAAFAELMRYYEEPAKLRVACGLTLAAHFLAVGLLVLSFIL